MKNHLLLIILNLGFVYSSFAFVLKPVYDNVEVANQQFDLNFEKSCQSILEFYTPENFKEATGRKPKFYEKFALKIFKKKMDRKLKRLAKKIDNAQADGCDIMFMINGEELEVRVLEITQTEIKYKKCNNPDSPIYTESKSEVFMIKYSNGIKEMIESSANPVTADSESYNDNDDELNTVGPRIVGVFGGLLLGLLGMLLVFIYPKGLKRKAFWLGWLAGFSLLILLIAYSFSNSY